MVPAFQNQLLATLPVDDQARLATHLEETELVCETELEVAGQSLKHVYFPSSGLASVVTHGPHGRGMEVGLFGWDGMSGLPLLHQAERSPFNVFMQVPGWGLRLSAEAFQEALTESASLQRHLLRYAQAHHVQISQTIISNGYGKLAERLARWLLMCDDRLDAESLCLTHKFLSTMLGVRRAGVTTALHELEGRGLIRAERELITIRDRPGLIEAADGSYGLAEAEYERLIGWRSGSSVRKRTQSETRKHLERDASSKGH